MFQVKRVCFCRNFPAIFLGSATGLARKMRAFWVCLEMGSSPPNGNFNRGNGDKLVDLLFSPKVPRETSDDDIVCNGIPR